MTGTHRICRNEAPHCKDWWTVERRVMRKSWLRAPVEEWVPVPDYRFGTYGLPPRVHGRKFESVEAAQAWIDEDKRPSVHVCGDPQ